MAPSSSLAGLYRTSGHPSSVAGEMIGRAITQRIRRAQGRLSRLDEWYHYVIPSTLRKAAMIRSYRGRWAETILKDRQVPRGFPTDLARVARRKLVQLNNAGMLGDLASP